LRFPKTVITNRYQHRQNGAANRLLLIVSVCLFQFGCTQLGPDFVKPEIQVVDDWVGDNPAISRDAVELSDWWTVFNDSILNDLVAEAFEQNLSLQITGLRILEARAQLGITVGNQYPQVQELNGSASSIGVSENGANFIGQQRPLRNRARLTNIKDSISRFRGTLQPQKST
jgi:outer membrane protein TolC